ncbi:hypothetical protein ACP70R_031398 [Stipagrostis hirtigluma subsp. patula]
MGSPIPTFPAPEGGGGGGSDADQEQQQQAPPPPPGAKAEPPPTVATHTRPIGIIRPPRGIRAIIEKTATFVAKIGPEFERRIISHNKGNSKFNFLQLSDPYHAYYQHRLSELADAPGGAEADGDADQEQQQQQAPPPPPGAKAEPPPTVATHTRTVGIIHQPPDIRVIIEKTAAFVAKNGPEFERRIISHNQGNKFNFLQPSDPYHAYYKHRVSELTD